MFLIKKYRFTKKYNYTKMDDLSDIQPIINVENNEMVNIFQLYFLF